MYRYYVLQIVTKRLTTQEASMRVREVIRDLPASRIAEISALGMGDPAVIPLWYG